MLLEELYNKEYKRVAEAAYVTTLQFYLSYNELAIYDRMLQHYEEQEDYAVCQGIHKAIDFIEETMDKRFDEATPEEEQEDGNLYTQDEFKKVSRLIFEDILKEIYERQVKTT
jgi:hypothetical protein